ncbi:MAG TPA: methyltransferase domain-containing protein [Humisphaera sp.]|nr:methyltransferase domain-containing protein [Humisphaera sp.]
MISPLVDARPFEAFTAGHVPGAASFPLEELAERFHELPVREAALRVMDSDAARASRAAALLETRGHAVSIVSFDCNALTEIGPPTVRLWQPNPFLVEALDRIASIRPTTSNRRALDIASGSGRDAVYLAMAGYDVEAIDLLPDALAKASDLARRCGVSITTHVADLERDVTLPDRKYDLIVIFRYLQRSLFPAIRDAVAPGGFVVYETFHERNLTTGRRPRSPAHLLRTGELLAAFEGFEVVIARDAVERKGRFFSHLLARQCESG